MFPFPSMLSADHYNPPNPVLVGSAVAPDIIQSATAIEVYGAGDNAFVYLWRPLVGSGYYWEFEVISGICLPGIVGHPPQVASFGGYTSTNAGVYTASGAFWREAAWGGSWSGSSLGGLSAGANLGFAYFAQEGRLVVRLNGVEVGEITFSGPPPMLYAHAGFQGGASAGQFRLGPSGCAYPKIPGTNHL